MAYPFFSGTRNPWEEFREPALLATPLAPAGKSVSGLTEFPKLPYDPPWTPLSLGENPLQTEMTEFGVPLEPPLQKFPPQKKPQEYREYAQQEQAKRRLEEQIRMTPEQFAELRRGIMESPDFSEQRKLIEQQEMMLRNVAGIPARPDLSPAASYFGLQPELFRGHAGGGMAAMEGLSKLAQERRDLLKSATDAAKAMVIGKVSTEESLLGKFLESLGSKKTESPDKQKRAFVQDFLRKETVKESVFLAKSANRAIQMLESAPGDETVRAYAQKVLASALEKGKLTNEDVEWAIGRLGLRETVDRVIYRWKYGKPLPQDVKVMKEAAKRLAWTSGNSLMDDIRGAAATAPEIYSLEFPPEHAESLLLKASGAEDVLKSAEKWREAWEKPPAPKVKAKPPSIDIKGMINEEIRRLMQKGK